jgi:hypothetical protein
VKTVAANDTDIETVSCDPGDAATGWTREGHGYFGPLNGHLTTVPEIVGGQPNGITFTFFCYSSHDCEDVRYRVFCLDLTQ